MFSYHLSSFHVFARVINLFSQKSDSSSKAKNSNCKEKGITTASRKSFERVRNKDLFTRMLFHLQFSTQRWFLHQINYTTLTWGRHSSVYSFAPTILQCQVQIPSTLSTLWYSQLLYYICNCFTIRTKINKKRPVANLINILRS